jgi:ATP phosphoribosyltransferase
MTETVRIALPSKGSLGQPTLDFLAAAGLQVNKTNPRQYTATIPALPQVWVMFQRPADIPLSVADGRVDLGITGSDRVIERHDQIGEHLLMLHEALNFGHCELLVAVPADWAGVDTVAALAEKARSAALPLRVANKYPNVVGAFLDEHGVAPCEQVYADGALEIAPTMGSADFIADISVTGTTLRENYLKPLKDGTILRAQACFIGNRAALQTRPEVRDLAHEMLEYFEAHLTARNRLLVTANIRGESAESVAARIMDQPDLGGLTGPTISPVFSRSPGESWFAVNLVVVRSRLYTAIEQLRGIGGSGVIVSPVSYIFDEYPARCRALDAALGNRGANDE